VRALSAISAAALLGVSAGAQGPAEAMGIALAALRDFELTATYHHVRLTGIDTARRETAVRLIERAQESLEQDRQRALLLFGLASEFPAPGWYADFLGKDNFGWLMQGREAAEAALGHPLVPVAPKARKAAAQEDKPPFVPPFESEPWVFGLRRNRIDLTNYPDRAADIVVTLDGKAAGRGRMTPPDKYVYARPGVGEYAITMFNGDTPPSTYRYPALCVAVVEGELLVNGEPVALTSAAWDGNVAVLEGLRSGGYNGLVLSAPTPEAVLQAQAAGFGVIVRPLAVKQDLAATLNAHGGSVAAVQQALHEAVARYAATGAVWLWDLGLDGAADAEELEMIFGPVLAYCDPLERPRFEAIR